jgi:hypothetical protein
MQLAPYRTNAKPPKQPVSWRLVDALERYARVAVATLEILVVMLATVLAAALQILGLPVVFVFAVAVAVLENQDTAGSMLEFWLSLTTWPWRVWKDN